MSTSPCHPEGRAATVRRRNRIAVVLLALCAAGFYVGHFLFRLWGQA